jgi:hypothetical protein
MTGPKVVRPPKPYSDAYEQVVSEYADLNMLQKDMEAQSDELPAREAYSNPSSYIELTMSLRVSSME